MSPIDKLRHRARLRALKRLGLLDETEEQAPTIPGLTANQTILSGTAYYTFNQFADYWKRWKAIIESKGEPKKLEQIFNGEIPAKFNWKDYSIIRLPVGLLPDGFMDERHISKAKATLHKAQYLMEYGACFAGDSNGFYKRSLVESCVVKNLNPITLPSCGEVWFTAALRGDPSRSYVFGVDPASEQDNFSIIVLECWPDHRRIVHCWTTTRSRHVEKVKRGLAQEHDFYAYAARKIRELMRVFPCTRIALDSQGGGIAVMEALHDPDKLQEGEKPLWPVIDYDKPAETDAYPGEHVLEMVQFARADYVSEANHCMRKDFEDKALLFPAYDPAVVGLAIEEDKLMGRVKVTPEGDERLYDTLEDCVMEIEELKDELASIVHSQTGISMRDRWDTPEIKQAGGKKGKLRKDRYSALLMANMAARQLARQPKAHEYNFAGGFARDLIQGVGRPARSRWQNPDWYRDVGGVMAGR
jgi:hypothetical protein